MEIEEVAKRASCHEFIMSLPKGYNTLAGDGGGNLSGGERQRIAIARAILKNSPVVVLDEATAFTDPENEAVIQASINELVRGKTLIVIAHRLGTIVEADKIIVMNGGKIESLGTHTELLVTCPLYETSAPSGMRNCAEIWGSIPLRAHCFWRMGIGIPF